MKAFEARELLNNTKGVLVGKYLEEYNEIIDKITKVIREDYKESIEVSTISIPVKTRLENDGYTVKYENNYDPRDNYGSSSWYTIKW